MTVIPKTLKTTRAQPKKLSRGEETLALHLRGSGLTGWERQYRFHPTRKLRAALGVKRKKANGSVSYGHHNRPKGFAGDCEKYNAAALLGWTVLRVTTSMVRTGYAVKLVETATKTYEFMRGRK